VNASLISLIRMEMACCTTDRGENGFALNLVSSMATGTGGKRGVNTSRQGFLHLFPVAGFTSNGLYLPPMRYLGCIRVAILTGEISVG
jgi:hypothetical protein